MPALRSRLRALGASPTAALFALLLGTYAYFYQAGGWNQNSRMNLVRAMVEDHTFRTDRFAKSTGDDAVREGHHYCDKAPGAQWLATPPYAVTYWLSGSPARPSHTWLAWATWLSIVFAIGLPSAIAALFLVRLARVVGLDGWPAYAVALTWGLGTMALPYSTLLYGNQLSGSLLIIAFSLLVELRHAGAAPSPLRLLAIGGCLGLAGATEYPAMLVVTPMAIYGAVVTWRAGGLRAIAWAVVGGAIPLGALALYHTIAFGSPATFPYAFSVWKQPHTGWFMGIGPPRGANLRGTFLGQHRGLLYPTPWLVLLVPGAIALGRRFAVEIAVAAWAVIAFVWLNLSIDPWHGGWATGPRYVVPMLPFAVLLCGGVLRWRGWLAARLHRGAAVAAGLIIAATVVWGAAHMFAATAVKPEISELNRRPYATVVWPKFRAGDLAISTQRIDMIGNPAHGPRAAWNLGGKLGLDGHAALVPLYLWWLATAIWLVRATRRRASAA